MPRTYEQHENDTNVIQFNKKYAVSRRSRTGFWPGYLCIDSFIGKKAVRELLRAFMIT